MEIKGRCQECGAIAQIKEWDMNYYVYKCAECAIKEIRNKLKEEKNYALLHTIRT